MPDFFLLLAEFAHRRSYRPDFLLRVIRAPNDCFDLRGKAVFHFENRPQGYFFGYCSHLLSMVR